VESRNRSLGGIAGRHSASPYDPNVIRFFVQPAIVLKGAPSFRNRVGHFSLKMAAMPRLPDVVLDEAMCCFF
jgi:hypothetical protein